MAAGACSSSSEKPDNDAADGPAGTSTPDMPRGFTSRNQVASGPTAEALLSAYPGTASEVSAMPLDIGDCFDFSSGSSGAHRTGSDDRDLCVDASGTITALNSVVAGPWTVPDQGCRSRLDARLVDTSHAAPVRVELGKYYCIAQDDTTSAIYLQPFVYDPAKPPKGFEVATLTLAERHGQPAGG